MDLQVHLHKRLLDMLGMLAGLFDETVAMAKNGTNGADLLGWPERCSDEPDGMKKLEPLAIPDIGFTSGDVLERPGVGQVDFEPGGFEDLIERDPIEPGRLQGNGIDPAAFKPGGKCKQVLSESFETTNRLGVPIRGNAREHQGSADVDRSRIGIDHRQGLGGRCAFFSTI